MTDNKFNYYPDKITKNTVRYQPDAAAQQLIGQATIYIQQNWLTMNGLQPSDCLTITIEKAGKQMSNEKTFDVYAHVRHSRQTLGDRMEQIKKTSSYPWPPVIDKMEEVYRALDTCECQLERILEDDAE